MAIWDKFTGKKEQKKPVKENYSLAEMKELVESGDKEGVFGQRCFMCMMQGKNNRPTWRFVANASCCCDEHKPVMDQLLRAQNPNMGDPLWERI